MQHGTYDLLRGTYPQKVLNCFLAYDLSTVIALSSSQGMPVLSVDTKLVKRCQTACATLESSAAATRDGACEQAAKRPSTVNSHDCANSKTSAHGGEVLFRRPHSLFLTPEIFTIYFK